jgi:hypothetical protein
MDAIKRANPAIGRDLRDHLRRDRAKTLAASRDPI